MTTSLPTTRLGWTGMHLTRAGFGAWAIGGGGWAYGWGNQDDTASIAAIRRAVESGINWIDTAAVYGLGHSEEVVAAALAGLPEADRPYVFTKGGLVWDPADRSAAPRRVGAPASIRTEVEASLRRLRVERIDLYQMHWPAGDGTPPEEYWQVFTDLKREGKIRAAGLSNHGIFQLEAAEQIGAVDAIQPPFNLIHRDAAADVLLWAREHEAGVIVYSPMASGLLTAAFTAARAARLEPGDWRAGHPDFTEPAVSANLALADALRPVADRHGVTPAAVAVAWTLTFPGVTGAIVGARSPRQVDGWLPAAALELKDDDLPDIAAAIHATGAGTGPASPPRTAGIHPDFPVRTLSHRTAYASVRAANSAPKNATFITGGDPASTTPGAASNSPACAGPGGRTCSGVIRSSLSKRTFSARNCATCISNADSSASSPADDRKPASAEGSPHPAESNYTSSPADDPRARCPISNKTGILP
jgi:aryl-alcohol dehydrogenase-like predicted oxidoreductase